METILVLATILSPIITALVGLLKKSVSLPKNLVPVYAVVIGMIIGYLAIPFTDLDAAYRLWAGGLSGLSSTGLFELAFNPRQGRTK
ncbi:MULTISPECIES: holin [unclassified Sporolactobacillus]|uniref:holin n=1 Tax=unclassified Sporolactobacillus TaxID=2628533 RepID=UPI00236773CB|nr:holin [Sporolactobacillus sp. CQH2019]MDD9149568.1 holin [Sporolactobacillus sp. CQH2019]